MNWKFQIIISFILALTISSVFYINKINNIGNLIFIYSLILSIPLTLVILGIFALFQKPSSKTLKFGLIAFGIGAIIISPFLVYGLIFGGAKILEGILYLICSFVIYFLIGISIGFLKEKIRKN